MTTTKGINSPVRQKNELYETPAWATRVMLDELGAQWPRFFPDPPEWILDPGAGSGAITRELRRVHPHEHIVAIELIDHHSDALCKVADEVYIGDYLACPVTIGKNEKFDLIFGNPPYSGPKRRDLAMEFVQHSMEGAKVTCMLTRLNWLGSQKRSSWMREHPPWVCILPKRPRFIPRRPGKSSTDSCEYAWMTWGMKGLEGTWKVLEI